MTHHSTLTHNPFPITAYIYEKLTPAQREDALSGDMISQICFNPHEVITTSLRHLALKRETLSCSTFFKIMTECPLEAPSALQALKEGHPSLELIEGSLVKSIEKLDEFPSCTSSFFAVLGHAKGAIKEEHAPLRARIPQYCKQFPAYLGSILSFLQAHKMSEDDLAEAVSLGLKECPPPDVTLIMASIKGRFLTNPGFYQKVFRHVEKHCPEHAGLVLSLC